MAEEQARQKRSFARGALAVLAGVVIAFCAWSMSEYVQGRDPLRWLPGRVAPAARELTDSVDEAARDAVDEGALTPEGDNGGEAEAAATEALSLSADDVRAALAALTWDDDDVSVPADDDVNVVLTSKGIWVEYRAAEDAPAQAQLERAATRLAALAAWAQGTEFDVPAVTWIEEDALGAVRMAARLRPDKAPRTGDMAQVLEACTRYAISGDAYATLARDGRPAQRHGKRPVLPDGSKVPVRLEQTPVPEAAPTNTDAGASSEQYLVSEDAAGTTAPAQPAQMTVRVTVDASAAGAGSQTVSVALAPGSTAYDALAATGVAIGTRGFGGGAWVTSISGIAEDASHGWTYTVDGTMPSAMSDRVEVHDGSSVVWSYVSTM